MSDACEDCLRRSWLLGELSHLLEYNAPDRGRLLALLGLNDGELIQAIAGRRREEIYERHQQFKLQDISWGKGVETICRHHRGYPPALTGDEAPRMLYVAGPVQRLQALGEQPAVAIVGSSRATDYGMEMARSLARGLAASGVTITVGLSDGIAVAAQTGALEVDGKSLTVMDRGLDMACPSRRLALYERVRSTGCAVVELPSGCRPRRWCYIARERIVVGMAQLTIVVEADEEPSELLGAHVAKALRRPVAAVPGRVTSPVSRGTHALLMEGAALVRGPEDALELLYKRDAVHRTARTPQAAQLEPRLKATLEQVGAGLDTPAKLTEGSADPGEVLLTLSELELMGLLTRGDGGRYVPRMSLADGAPL
jgi:DNA processing protein